MPKEKSQFDKTAAADKSIGFDYQYYYFLLQLLKLRAGQKIGLEVKDDIYIVTPDKNLALLQLKHTTQQADTGQNINLAERSIEMWKTISNWIDVVRDPAEDRVESQKQMEFLKTTNFVLVSNKEESDKNKFLKEVKVLKEEESIPSFHTYLNALIVGTEDSKSNKTLREYMLKLRGLPNVSHRWSTLT